MAQGGRPTADHERVYGRWGQGGWAALVTGNIMVDHGYLGGPGDVAVTGTDWSVINRWSKWTKKGTENGCLIIAQLSHPGRQSPRGDGTKGFFTSTLAPSAIPLNLGDKWIAFLARVLMFGTPQAMTRDQIDEVIAQFARAARLASQSGFHGVEIQAGHGFLISQFLSAAGNTRTDEFGGSPEHRAEFLLRILRAVRGEVLKFFCIGVKINTADHMDPHGLDHLLRQIRLIGSSSAKVDYIQLSGGTFEDPQMMTTEHSVHPSEQKKASTIAREGFFLDAAREIREALPHLTLFVTGGFRSAGGIEDAIASGACDAVCLGRPAVKYPDLPHQITAGEAATGEEIRFDVEAAPSPGWIATKIKAVGSGAESAYWAAKMKEL